MFGSQTFTDPAFCGGVAVSAAISVGVWLASAVGVSVSAGAVNTFAVAVSCGWLVTAGLAVGVRD